jgi:[citrate (pro-3S)-lyase] ligase
LKIFGQHIDKTLHIKTRYVGDEPFNETTAKYNEMMKIELESAGIEIIIIPRLEYNQTAISASKVRELLYLGEFDTLRKMVPATTYDFLVSKKAQAIISKIKQTYTKKNLV